MGDGSACVIVASDAMRRKLKTPAVRIAASVLHSGQATAGFRDMLRPEISFDSASDAYEAAGFGPKDLDVVELHDAFSIAEFVYYEALGSCPAGESADYLRAGKTTYGGAVVVNPSGGLFSTGHPVGARAVAQAVDVNCQLPGQEEGWRDDGGRPAL